MLEESSMSNNKVILLLDNGERVENPEISGLKVDFFDKNNLVEIQEGAVFHNTHLKLRTSCHILIEKTHPRGIRNTVVDMAGSTNAELFIGSGTSIESARFAMANENDISVNLGKGCLLSSNIVFRATDGHVIYNISSREILNKTRPINIGNNVWIGANTVVLKGAEVADNSIIGTMSLVSRKFKEENTAIAGNPAEVVKKDILWSRQYIKDWII